MRPKRMQTDARAPPADHSTRSSSSRGELFGRVAFYFEKTASSLPLAEPKKGEHLLNWQRGKCNTSSSVTVYEMWACLWFIFFNHNEYTHTNKHTPRNGCKTLLVTPLQPFRCTVSVWPFSRLLMGVYGSPGLYSLLFGKEKCAADGACELKIK